MENILDFIMGSAVNSRTIKKFCKLVFEQELTRYGFPFEVTLRVCWQPYHANGYVRFLDRKRIRRASITINTASFLRDRSKHSAIMTWFYIYATLVHELQHIQLTLDLEGETPVEYNRFIAALCQINKVHGNRRIGIVPNYMQMKTRMTSLPELICTQVGFSCAYSAVEKVMDMQERELVSDMIESLNFLCDHMEITYAMSSQPYNQFSRAILSLHQRVRKDTRIWTRFKQTQRIVDADGNFYSPQFLYEQGQSTGGEFYDNVLIHLFLLLDMNWRVVFDNNSDLFLHMERLANQYCQHSVYYLKNIDIGERFLSADVLQDNAAMLIRSTERMNALMKRFGMKHTGGSLIPLYV